MAIAICPAPFVICWQQHTKGDESTDERRSFASLADAEVALECLYLDPASTDIRPSWLELELLGELETIPF